ncbi:aminotransferase class I/II-fold pyridoxal phosphate-dependent enzyme [Fulvivirgaceae bacterium BMA12]|uniref:Aminotransferase class I/II-fold pyridoxal phosphate-dependent enzyme n=1 Tax=Agaribacillus aureus TaxID=3051825 RepID=A0ABT8KZT2_9BACT|nr:aminotransferase class I/II-fold pyridoxal phosphate-dependent enzyme [Fulvivirgaceae bacterium BMA12]
MSEFRIKLAPPDIDAAMLKQLPGCFANGAADPGKSLRRFEQAICQRSGVTQALAVNSGTSALHLALLALGVNPGDEVLCPAFTFVATINAISYVGAIPIIVDSERDTWNMDPGIVEDILKSRVASNKKPAALLLAHTYGMPAKVAQVVALCQKYEIPVIEDAAGSLGARYEGQFLGTFGDVGILSFNYNKIITTGGGGMLLTNRADIKEKAAYLATQARSRAPYYVHRDVGYNYQMNGLAAELGASQIHLLDERIKKKRTIFNNYYRTLQTYDFIAFQEEQPGSCSNRWLTTLIFDRPDIAGSLKKYLEENSIEARHLWNPMHRQPVFKHHPQYINGTADWLFKHGLALPSGTNLSEGQQAEIIDLIRQFLKT